VTRNNRVKVFKAIGVHAFAIGVLLVLTFAEIDARISPFAVAFLFASIYMPVNKIAMAVIAFLFSLFVGFGQQDILASGFAVLVFLGMFWILIRLRQHKKWRKKFDYAIVITGYVLSNILNIVFVWGGELELLYRTLVSVLVGVVFLSACMVFIIAARTRKGQIPWTLEQKICLGVFVTVISLGLAAFDTDYFSLHKFVCIFVILAGVTMFDPKSTLVVAVCLGLGRAFADLDLGYVAVYALLALSAVAFKARERYLSVIAVIVTDAVLGFYFEAYWGYGVFDVVPVLAASILVLVLPAALGKYFDFSRAYLSGHLVSKNTINKNRAGVFVRLNNLSNVFNEMQHIYKGLVQGSIPDEDSAKMIASTVVENVCDSCPKKPDCRRNGGTAAEVDSGIEKLAYIGLQRGAVNFLDLPSGMTMKCTRLNSVLNMANNLVDQVRAHEKAAVSLDASKVLMAGLLSGVSKLCKTFADDVCASVVFDNEKAQVIKDELLGAGIVASDCLIAKNNSGEYSVSVLVSRGDAGNKAIERVISKAAGHAMQIDSVDDGDTAGFSIVTAKTAPRFALTFGVAQVSKDFHPRNGDTFSFLKVTNDKTLMAICDGMGAGEAAEKASILALSLVENFYKAGFPNEIIMTSVNQLLTITQQEVFSALDIAVFNLADGCVNFIKVGGVDGYVKRAREVEVVEAGSLPLGIVEEMSPKITRAVLGAGDMVVLCSDGVSDSFGDRVALASFINNITGTPQQIADDIMAEALNRAGRVAIDDCTVVVAGLQSTRIQT